MDIFNKISLRAKLIASFVFIALVVSIISFIVPQLAFQRVAEDSVPFLEVVGEIRATVTELQMVALEFVASGEETALGEYKTAAVELSEASELLEQAQFRGVEAAEAEELAGLLTQMTVSNQKMLASHSETLEKTEALETIETDLEKLIENMPEFESEEVDEVVHKLHETLHVARLEAIEFVATGREATKEELPEADVESLLPALEQAELATPEEADYIARLVAVANLMESGSEQIVASHQGTLDILDEMEATEEEVEETLAGLQVVSEKAIDSSVQQVRVFIVISSAVVLVLAILLGVVLTNNILKPLQQLRESVRQLGAGAWSVRASVKTHDEIGEMAGVFNQMADQLQQAFAQSQEEYEHRVRQIEISSEISRQMTTILDVDELLHHTVTNIQDAFSYYHVHIYLIHPETKELVMREGTGEIGRQLKAKGHKLEPGQGIVGQVADSGEAFLAPDVDEVPGFVRNPLLPETRAELAVPLRKGSVILGVLDMQNETVGSFSQEEVVLMQTIADQIAVALENARLVREVRAAAAEAEALTRRLTRSTWQDISDRVSATGYVFTKSGATPMTTSRSAGEETWLPTMTEAVAQKKLTYAAENGDNEAGPAENCLSIPLMLRDEVIGVIGIERDVNSPESGTDKSRNIAPWTEDELATVQQVAEQVALALETTRLARETERAAWRDRVVSESTASVWATSEIEEVMKAAVSQLGDRLRASEVVIRLGKEDELLPE